MKTLKLNRSIAKYIFMMAVLICTFRTAPAMAVDEVRMLYDFYSIYDSGRAQSDTRFQALRTAGRKAASTLVEQPSYFNGTLATLSVVRNWPNLSDATRAELADWFQETKVVGRAAEREAYQYSTSCQSSLSGVSSYRQSDHFLIYYTTLSTSQDKVSSTGTGNTPDYILNLLQYAEEIWEHEIGYLGLEAPPLNNNKFVLYVCDIVGRSNLLGLTVTDEYYSDGTARSYIELDNDYSGVSLYNNVTIQELVQVTLAHEFFHAIQFGLNWRYPSYWVMESSAVWMEDEVYPEANDYIGQYLSTRFNNMDTSLDHFSYYDTIAYGSSIFWKYVSEKVGGSTMMTSIWNLVKDDTQECSQSSCSIPGAYEITEIPQLETYLATKSTNLDTVYKAYTLAVYNKDFVDGALSYFPSITPTSLASSSTVASGDKYLDHLSTHYYKMSAGSTNEAKQLEFDFSGASTADWGVTIILVREDGATVLHDLTVSGGQVSNYTMEGWGTAYKNAIVIVSNLDTTPDDDNAKYNFTFTQNTSCNTLFTSSSLDPGWNLFAPPLTARYSLPSTAMGISDSNIRSWDPGAGSFYTGGESGFTDLGNVGVGYWLYQAAGGTVSLTGCAVTDTSVDVKLTTGWNMFGNPFTTSVGWADSKITVLLDGSSREYALSQAVANGWLNGAIYGWASGDYAIHNHNSSYSLTPWKGYWVEAKKDVILRISK